MTANQATELRPNSRKTRYVQRDGLKYNPGARVTAMLHNLAESRCRKQARDTMHNIGQYLVDHYLEGVITRGQLLSIREPNTDRRTLWRHVNLLVECGALIPMQDGKAYEVAHFLDHNYTTARREAWREKICKKNDWSNGHVDVVSTSTRPTGEEENRIKSTTYTIGARQGTGSTNSLLCSLDTDSKANKHTEDDSSNANNVPPLVDSKKKAQKPKSSIVSGHTSDVSEEEWQGMLQAMHARGGNMSPDDQEPLVKGDGAESSLPASPPDRHYEPARMPSDESPSNEHSCIKALKEVHGKDPVRMEVDYLRKCMNQLKARDVELGYAKNRALDDINKGVTIHHMVHYLTGIIETQRCHWRRKIEDEGYDPPAHLVSLGPPSEWPVRGRARAKHGAQPQGMDQTG